MPFVAKDFVAFVAKDFVSFVAKDFVAFVAKTSWPSWLQAMNRCHHADQKIEANLVANLEPRLERLRTDSRDSRLAVGFVRERVVHVVRQLAMNADRLHSLQHTFSRSFQHGTLY